MERSVKIVYVVLPKLIDIFVNIAEYQHLFYYQIKFLSVKNNNNKNLLKNIE